MDPLSIAALAGTLAKMFGLDIKLGRMINGDKGAEMAERITSIATGVTGASTPADILKRLQDDSDMWNDLREELLKFEAEESARQYADRADARDMQKVALGQDDVFSKRFVYYFAAAWSLFTMGYIAFITFAAVPPSSQRFADTILGFLLGTIVATIINYFFGSTKSSKDKDGHLGALVEAIKEKTK